MTRVLIVTDSTCDIPPQWVAHYDLRIVPTYVQFGTESLADDGVQLPRSTFYHRLASSPVHPTTAAPPLGQTREVLSQALEQAENVVAITAPAALSGIYNTFRLAADQLAPARVTLIDSTQLTMGLGWQVLRAAELAQAGASPAEIAETILQMRPHVDVWAALDTLLFLRRSGRVGWAASFVGDLFKVKPVVRLHDSAVSSIGRARTTHRAFDMLVELAHQAAPLERLAILHTSNLEGARQLEAALADIRPSGEVPCVEVTPVIGVHVGPMGLGLAVVRQS